MPAPSPYVTGQQAQDVRGRPVTGRQVAGQGQVAARGVGLNSADANGPLASTHVMSAEKTAVAAAGASAYVAPAVWLDRILVTTAGTAELVVYDNAGPAGTATGTIIATVPANATRGTYVVAQMPVAVGISVVGAAGTPAVTFSYA